MNEVETIKKGNYTINIYQEDCSESPREWDNLGTIIGYCKSYKLYDKELSTIGNNDNMWEDFLEYIDNEYNIIMNDKKRSKIATETLLEQDIKKLEKWVEKNIIYLSVNAYIHSGVSVSTSQYGCKWDSGQVGYIYITKEKILNEFGGKKLSKKLKEKIAKLLESEIKTFNQYCQGNIYWYNIKDEFGNTVGSCGGFYGYDWDKNGLLDYANEDIQARIEEEMEIQKIVEMVI